MKYMYVIMRRENEENGYVKKKEEERERLVYSMRKWYILNVWTVINVWHVWKMKYVCHSVKEKLCLCVVFGQMTEAVLFMKKMKEEKYV